MTVTARNASIALSLLVIVLAPPGRAAPADQAGVASAVNTTALSLPPGGSERMLDVGVAVVQRERIATDTEGQAQLLMLDGSSFTIGPGASVVLDEFYFDPESGSGRAGLSLAKGLLRFVGGKLSKSQAVTIETPNGTVGIRGGIAVIEVDEATTSTRATFLYGSEMTVTGKKGGIEKVTRPGYAVTVQRNAAPLKPVRVTAAQLTKVTTTLSAHSTAKPVPQEAKARGPALAPARPAATPPVTPSVTRSAFHPHPPPKPPIPARHPPPPRPPPKKRVDLSPSNQCAGESEICG
jgi:trimeric autotransporter adhesin